MGRVHWVGGEKGGVGKSVVARLLAQYWIDRAISFKAFDTDRSHGAMLRHYSGYTEPIEPRRMEEFDRIVAALDDQTEEIVVDLAAQTEADLEEWLVAGDVLDVIERLGHALWFWYVIDDGKASVRLLADFLDRFEGKLHVVCVKNHGRGRNFVLFDESKLANRITQRGGAVIDLPELHGDSMRSIDAYDKSFWAAIHNTEPDQGPCLTRMERERAKVFIRRAHEAFRGLLNPNTLAS